ncbi:DUF938 domain-containing protein [Stenotrophomonas sp. YIM B06876]|uniref:DUF938 domain-containing protein n=1 Tax=Stenotrophomonas sp. YIM B06876 TaxID=3060211 RepID=UPI00273A290D|nr:DUF938 domain-containing protein [Stenotrophomonas sp. YIM B06876]
MSSRPYSESCERNREPILAVLRRHFAHARQVLEIGSGTGQHAVHFAAAMPWLRWQSSDHRDHLPGISQWLEATGLANTPPPIELQAVTSPVPGLAPPPVLPQNASGSGFDAVFSANTLHIMGWDQVQALFAGLSPLLATAATLVIYGPFNYGGDFSSDSNRTFDAWLKGRDPRSGIRDFEAVDALARAQGWTLREDVAMPANNRCLVWTRQLGMGATG